MAHEIGDSATTWVGALATGWWHKTHPPGFTNNVEGSEGGSIGSDGVWEQTGFLRTSRCEFTNEVAILHLAWLDWGQYPVNR